MRLVAVAGLILLVLAMPIAAARLIVEPDEMALGAAHYAQVRIEIQNRGPSAFAWTMEASGDGLVVELDKTSGAMAPHTDVAFNATVRAMPWSVGEHVVRFTLFEDGRKVDEQKVVVRVTGLAGLDEPTVKVARAGLVGGLVGGSLVGLVAWRRWHLVAAALYTRIHRDAVEKHPSRARIVEIVRETPGITMADAQRASGLANGPFEHHLGKLREAGRVFVLEQGRSRLLRLPESGPIDPAMGTSATVAQFVRERGKVRASEVARALAISRQALHYHVRKLSTEGLIDARIERGRLTLAPRGA